MKLTVGKSYSSHNEELYYIELPYYNSLDRVMAKKLNISTLKYRNILRKFKGAICNDSIDNDEIFFKTESDAEAAIEALEPYLIMAKLTED